LKHTERSRAQIETIAEFTNGYPEKSRLLDLLEQIEQLYKNNEFTVVWLNNGGLLYTKIANKEDISKISCLWERIAGNYMLFLPHNAVVDKKRVLDEEEFIGKCLEKHGQLVLKTEDACVVLFLQLH